jgi:hypothetical protein
VGQTHTGGGDSQRYSIRSELILKKKGFYISTQAFRLVTSVMPGLRFLRTHDTETGHDLNWGPVQTKVKGRYDTVLQIMQGGKDDATSYHKDR